MSRFFIPSARRVQSRELLTAFFHNNNISIYPNTTSSINGGTALTSCCTTVRRTTPCLSLGFHPDDEQYYGSRRLPYQSRRQWRSNHTAVANNSSHITNNEILLEHHRHETDSNAVVTTLTLSRPKANAMGKNMLQELRDCLDVLEQQQAHSTKDDDEGQQQQQQHSSSSSEKMIRPATPPPRCLVLTSYSSKVFSAGADLKERATMSQEEASEYVTLLRNTMERIHQLPIPVIASVEGVAVGGGLEIALAADLLVASRNATFGLPETSLAIIPGAGGTQRLPRLIGMARAKELIWTGRRVTAEEAYEYGLVQHVVDPGEAVHKAMELSWKIAQNGPIAIRASKQAINDGLTVTTMPEALEIERQNYQRVLPTSDRLEGLSAFKEGRTPQYKGE